MKYYLTAIGIIFLVLSFNACKINPVSPVINNNNNSVSGSSYYPNEDGNRYKYSIIRTDSAGNETTGSRSVTYDGTSNLGSVTYQIEVDTTTFSALINTTNSLFLKDSSGVSIILDTTGFSKIIPAAYQPYVVVNQTLKIFQSSFLNGNQWTAFDMSLKLTWLMFLHLLQALKKYH